VAEQRCIKEEAQAKLAAAHQCNEKKWQERKAKEEEDKAIREKSLEEAQKQQLIVSCLNYSV